jgi:DNA-binding CsgD family transcriptional regulator
MSSTVVGRRTPRRYRGHDTDHIASPAATAENLLMGAAATSLFGRDDEFARIRDLLQNGGGPAALVIEGEAGIGKTALWEAALELAHRSGRTVLSCRPTAAEASLSFSALSDLLEPVAEDALPSLPAPQARALAAALLLAEPVETSGDARGAAAATLGVLRTLSSREPVLLAIDDGQWLDSSSAAALAHAVRRLRSERVAVVQTLRTPHADPLDLASSTSRWPRGLLTIGPLDVDALHAVVRSQLGVVVTRPTMQRIHEISGGRPFFAVELVRSLPSRDGRIAARELALPPSLHDVVVNRIARLDGAVRETLAAAALLAGPALPTLAAAFPDARAHIASAESDGIVVLERQSIRFAHPLLASAAAETLGTLDRAELHLRLAEAVTDSEQRARHLALGTIEPNEAIAGELEDAGARCAARGASTEAAELFEHAVRLTPGEHAAERCRRKRSAAECTFSSGDWARARELFAELEAELPAGPDRARSMIASFPTIAYASVGIEVAHRVIAEADGDAQCLADGYRCLAQALAYRGDIGGALGAARTAVTLAETSGDVGLRVRCAGVLARFETYTGDITPGLLEAAVELEGDTLALTSGHSPTQQLGERRFYGDRLGEGRVILERALIWAMEQGDEPSHSNHLLYLTQLEVRAGNWARAHAHAAELYELDAQLYGIVERTYFARALVDAHLGHVDETRVLLALDEEESIGVPEPIRWEHVMNRWILGFLDLSVGDLASAAGRLRPLPTLLEDWGYGNPGVRPVLPDAIESLVGVGELEEARMWATKLAEQGRKLDNPWACATAARSFALIAAAEGHSDEALALLEEALGHHARSENPFERGRTLLILGETLRRARRKRASRDALMEALDVFDTLGAALWAEKASAELARIGGRRPSAGTLTPTEQRVAALVADGKSNKEIAAALFVTVRTVETHLRHIYEKLGVRSRAELAGIIARRVRDE